MNKRIELRPAKDKAPELSNWGVFGEDDEIGTLNYLSPEAVLGGVSSVLLGHRYPLNLPIDEPSEPVERRPRFKPDAPPFQKTTFRINAARSGLVVNDDHIAVATQGSSQWDAFMHVGLHEDGVDGVFYNGVTPDSVDATGRAQRNGIDKVARVGIAGRGVLIDIARMVSGGGSEPLPSGHEITTGETAACLQRQGSEIREGDIVCFRTGWTETYMESDQAGRALLMAPEEGGALPAVAGINPDHAEMAYEQRWAAVAADNAGVELLPMEEPTKSAHVRMMRNLGLPFGELLLFRDLSEACASDGRYEFFFVAVPMWIPGGMGSPANAMAIR